jgi:hypothetical protein
VIAACARDEDIDCNIWELLAIFIELGQEQIIRKRSKKYLNLDRELVNCIELSSNF